MQNNDKIDVFSIAPDISYEICPNDFLRSLMEDTTIDRVSWLEKSAMLAKKGVKKLNVI